MKITLFLISLLFFPILTNSVKMNPSNILLNEWPVILAHVSILYFLIMINHLIFLNYNINLGYRNWIFEII